MINDLGPTNIFSYRRDFLNCGYDIAKVECHVHFVSSFRLTLLSRLICLSLPREVTSGCPLLALTTPPISQLSVFTAETYFRHYSTAEIRCHPTRPLGRFYRYLICQLLRVFARFLFPFSFIHSLAVLFVCSFVWWFDYSIFIPLFKILSLYFFPLFLRSGPNRGQSPEEFISCLSIGCLSIYLSLGEGQPARLEGQLARSEGQPARSGAQRTRRERWMNRKTSDFTIFPPLSEFSARICFKKIKIVII